MSIKQKLFEQMLAKKGIQVTGKQPIPRRANPESAELSLMQERLWVLHQLVPNNAAYNMFVAKRLLGPLDSERLRASFQVLIERHEILRTIFRMVDGKPMQYILPQLELALPVIDLQQVPIAERAAELRQRASAESLTPFDLAQAPLLRVQLLKFSAEEHVLFLCMHHIISDGWSLDVIFRELTTIYASLHSGQSPSLPELPIQYGDYAVWQRNQLQGEALERQRNYWLEQLRDATPTLALPTDRPRSSVQTAQGASQVFVLTPRLTRALEELGKREEVTLFMVLLAAYAVLLGRYSQQEDMLIATTSANRPRDELEGLIGLFMTVPVLHVNLEGNPTFQQLLKRVREVCLGAYAHQDIPVEQILEVLRPQRDLKRASLLQVNFALQNMPHTASDQFAGVTLTDMEGAELSDTAKLEVSFTMWDTPNGLSGLVEYNAGLFEAATIERMIEHYQTILERIVADSTRPISTLLPFGSDGQLSQATVGDMYELTNLTRTQLLFWIGQKFQPDVPIYNAPGICFLRGHIDPKYFEQAMLTLVRSSDALRTVIEERDGIPMQCVRDMVPYEVVHVDFSDAADPRQAFRLWSQEYGQRMLAMDTCLFEVAFARLSDDESGFFFNIHHLITDVWSHALLGRYLVDLYALAAQEQLPDRIEMPSFQEHVANERAQRHTKRMLKAQEYWENKLAEITEPLTFYGRQPIKRTTRFYPLVCELGTERTRKLTEIAQQFDTGISENASLFHVFATILYAYLHRISGNQQIVIHVPFHNRRTKAAKNTIGLFMETLPARVTIDERDTFLSLLEKVSNEMAEVMRYSYYSVTNPRQQSPYDVVLNFQVVTQIDFGGGYTGTIEPVEPVHAEYSMLLQPHDYFGSGNLIIDFGFHYDIFDPDTRDRAVAHFLGIVDAFLADPAQFINRVDLLPPSERQQLLCDFNQASLPLPNDLTLDRLFTQQVHRTPDRIAVTDACQSLTYACLDARANRLAHYLQARGVGPETCVGVYMERSCELIVALLAILKAGAAYLPLDPTYPTERVMLLLNDAQARLLLTHQQLSAALTEHGAECICLDQLGSELAQQPSTLPQPRSLATNLAYIIYTSGSTGRPKGVMVSHANIVNAALAWEQAYQLQQSSLAHLQMASSAFDVFTGDLVRALSSGGRLVICPADFLLSPPDLAALIQREGVNIGEFVPVVLRGLLEHLRDQQQTLPSMRAVIVGSDRWYGREHLMLRAQFGDAVQLLHSYGVTEATVDSSYFAGTVAAESIDALVPIGQPFANTQLYVLDAWMRPVPIGVAGELYIGGNGIARGYYQQPALSATRFIPDPFSTEPGARLYRTGDMACWRGDGVIEFLGRHDHQVKLRGYRIETGEIEALLRAQAGVRRALVILRRDLGPEPQLVAYLVAEEAANLNASSLRNHLQAHLPHYMVPSAFVFLNEMPLTPNGKINQAALPRPDINAQRNTAAFVPPQTPTEQQVAAIWSQVLKVDQIGRNDSFFELGGYSLLITQIVARLRESFQVELPMRSLFEAQTVAELARLIDDLIQPSDAGSSPSISAEELLEDTRLADTIRPPFPLASYPSDPDSVLLTGATGFLGAFLLADLLSMTKAHVYCLVRADDHAAGQAKLKSNLVRYGLWQDAFAHRIHPVLGDLAEPRLGLAEAQFNDLAGMVDIIYHSGALVHFTQPYAPMRAANVLGTSEVLRLAAQGRLKPVHMVSTISIFAAQHYNNLATIYEDDALEQAPVRGNGYTQTKWVAERMVMAARARGIPVNIYRPGRITGHSKTGAWNSSDLLCQIIKGCVRLGSTPELDFIMPMVPVDYVSQAILHLSQQEKLAGQTFHIINPQGMPLKEISAVLARFGFPITQLPYDAWRQKLQEASVNDPADELSVLLTFFPTRWPNNPEANRGPVFDQQHTLDGLANSGISCPPTDNQLVTRYLSYLTAHGILELPGKAH